MIRAGRIADLEAVLALERETATAPHWPSSAYEQAATEPGRCLLVAEEDGAVVGFAVAAMAGEDAELESVAVRSGDQGRGLGEALVRAALAWAQHAGGRAVVLEVRAGSAGARRLYGRCGFVEVGLRRGYYSGPADSAVVMRCGFGAGVGDV